ncbi:MAG TPA: LCP family protein [Candidatus Baltobacteraceae bacterium]|jgi:LCP family protein required for cell wall assembly|nr:LCP family protein [Candidatus Baltobacteraceae bacterium]
MKSKRIAVALALSMLAVAGTFFALHDRIASQVTQVTAQREFGSDILNVLLLGYQEDEGNSDTILVAHLDTVRRTATLVSIPRDSWVEIPGHGHWKINAAIGYGGPALVAGIVSKLIRAPIDATIALRPEDAKQIVDAMGGLNVDVDEDMDYDDNAGDLHIHLRKGEQYLTGGQVLEYIRFRHDAQSDWGRVRRQQQILKDILGELSLPQEWAKVPHVLALAAKDVKTTLTQTQIAALLTIYRGVPDDNVRTFTMPARDGWVGDASVVFLNERWARLIGRLLFSKSEPPGDEVVVANATGDSILNRTVVAALRGGGWNVPTFIDQPVKKTTRVLGTNATGRALAIILGTTATPNNARQTVLVLGTDLAPDSDG